MTVAVALCALAVFVVVGGTGVAGEKPKAAKAQDHQDQNGTKVVVCHKSKVTIHVSVNAWSAHDAHGDSVGACTAATTKNAKHAQAKADKAAARAAKKEAKAAARSARKSAGDDESEDAESASADGPGNGHAKAKGDNKG